MTTDPSWLNPCEPTDPELLDALKAETERRTDEFMRLRNAAPDLLAALKDMLSGWRYIRQYPAHQSIYGVGWDRAQSAAESAIAKAEGRTP